MPKSIHSKRQEQLCNLLVEARLDAGLTQQQVADGLGHPQSYVAKIEGGERRLDVIEYIEFCECLKVDPSSFLRLVQGK